MIRIYCLLFFLLNVFVLPAQELGVILDKALQLLAADEQFKHSQISLNVVETNTGKKIFSLNAETGMAPASCQKIITSASAFAMLGTDFRFQTIVSYNGRKEDHVDQLLIEGTGDPTLGSDRFEVAKERAFLTRLQNEFQAASIKTITAVEAADHRNFASQTIPDGWVWQDLGNYFGAGAAACNWKENQFNIILKAGKSVGEKTAVVAIEPAYCNVAFQNECTTGPARSGDNAYIYHGLNSTSGFIRGTIPLGEDHFSISGAVADPGQYLKAAITDYLTKNKMLLNTSIINPDTSKRLILYTYNSPSLDSINYWFMKKSINLYGEAFVKAIALSKRQFAATDTGVKIMKQFWADKGISEGAMNVVDGSGLSPSNRVTTSAMVAVLQFARLQKWFNSFYNALPEMNGIKMKDGYIGGVRSYAGFTTLRAGTGYSFAFIVNNFTGSPSLARQKIYKVLDILK